MSELASTQSKRALITGITGQDGSYLAELLLTKGYEVSKRKGKSHQAQLTMTIFPLKVLNVHKSFIARGRFIYIQRVDFSFGNF